MGWPVTPSIHAVSLSLPPPSSHTHTHTHTPHIQTHTPVLRTRISRWLHSSQIRSIFHPSKKTTPLSSHCSLEAAHCHSHSCVTAINHPSMWNGYTITEKTRRGPALSFSPQTPPSLSPDIRPQTPSSCLTSIRSSFPSSSHHLSPRRDSVSWFIIRLVTLSHICRDPRRQTNTRLHFAFYSHTYMCCAVQLNTQTDHYIAVHSACDWLRYTDRFLSNTRQ